MMLSPRKYNAVKISWTEASLTYETFHTTSKGDVFIAIQSPVKTSRTVLGQCTAFGDKLANKMGPLTTPTKRRDVRSVDPWTPTSNLKMLISAASPDIRNREKELCLDHEGVESLDASQESKLGEDAEKLSRKEKSLGLLCHRFLARYPDYPGPAHDICLDDVATQLNVERRRIYDIMNVLESLHMVSRLVKNRYTWHGRSKLAQTLAVLRRVGEGQRYRQQMQHIRQRCAEKEFDFDDGEEKENDETLPPADLEGPELGQKEMSFVELPGVEFNAVSVNSRKDKSLRVMSQKFVMLFLVSDPNVVSLEVAAKILIGEDPAADQDKNKFKTKVRRLYDIANVLQSLKLIEKVHVTEERGRKTAFKWTGPAELPTIEEPQSCPAACRPPAASRVSEPVTKETCSKNLFSSPGGKRGFTRHPSLIKMAKSIQEDRRKINSAPTSPAKSALGDSSNQDFPSKMAQLAAICKMQLDQQSSRAKGSRPGSSEPAANKPETHRGKAKGHREEVPVRTPTQEPAACTTPHLTPRPPQQQPAPPSSMSYLPAGGSPLIPVLLPQQHSGGPYAVFLHALRPNPLSRPKPTSLAVRSMTFEEKTGLSPGPPGPGAPLDLSPSATKRLSSDTASEGSPSKAKRVGAAGHQDTSPRQGEALHVARLKARRGGPASSRPSSRALHLDPEFVNTPGGAAAVAHQFLEESVETFLETEERGGSDSEAGLTPVPARAVPLTPGHLNTGHLNTETLVPAGYLIPMHSLVSYKDMQVQGGENKKSTTPTYNIYHTPTAGSRPPHALEITPTGLPRPRPAGLSPQTTPAYRAHMQSPGPSPAIFNFTLQNLGLISAGPGSAGAQQQHQTPERGPGPGASPLLGVHQRGGVLFVKPLSSTPLQQAGPAQSVTFISVQQPTMTTPKGAGQPQHSFFHTPGPLSPLAAMATHGGHAPASATQRKLDVSTQDSPP
ncbi:transcription factor E2F8 isoform X1 [Gadus chalcogrammus]|uniref:transcription factor E2F8 isoform X1 n=2 Tax=Gadus chalcogrammus TaxID=1042646 RepID=UPI0024C4D69F|nr:transcription factor E2F8 isoform X1 [Gadus chalcogrammus]